MGMLWTTLCIVVTVSVSFISCQKPISEELRYSSTYVSPYSTQYEKRKGYMVQYQPGDVLIGGMIPIHARGDEDTCGLPTEQGTQGIEIFNIVLDELNSNRGFLPGVKLGSLIIDTCDVDTHAVQRVANIFLPYLTGTVSHTETKKTLFAGVLGATSSAVSMQTTSLLQVFHVLQKKNTHL
ncbi:unnamed protein product [Clavelina lepadiformis]|uniref:Receptor ligand binding region domain-containing protein n=1 Tax=Clavelina lepadiformis TaxID=159417 RepID=A0ABP0GQV2_CLALP